MIYYEFLIDRFQRKIKKEKNMLEIKCPTCNRTIDNSNLDGLVKIKVILIKSLLNDILKMYNPIPIVRKGALENEQYFLNNYWKRGVFGIIRETWTRKHPQISPVEYLAIPYSKDFKETIEKIKPLIVSLNREVKDENLIKQIKEFDELIDIIYEYEEYKSKEK